MVREHERVPKAEGDNPKKEEIEWGFQNLLGKVWLQPPG